MKAVTNWTVLGAAVLSATMVTACSSSAKKAASGATSAAGSVASNATSVAGSVASDATSAVGSVAASATDSGSGAASSPAAKMGKIVYIPGLTGNPFYNTVSCGAGTEAKKKGVDFAYQGSPTFDVQKQTAIVEQVTATKPGAIMISITDPNAMAAPLKKAKAAGIKIVTIDGDLTDTSISSSNIQSNGVQGGKLAGEALGKAIGGKGSVLIVDNATGSTVAKARDDGFTEGIKEFPNVKLLPIQYSQNDPAKAAAIVKTASIAHSDLAGVFGAETNNTQGALTGVKEATKIGKIKVTGYDTSDPIVAALKDGSLLGTVVQNPRGEGVTGVDTALDVMSGKTVPRSQPADAIFVTPATVNSAKAKLYIYDVNCKIQ